MSASGGSSGLRTRQQAATSPSGFVSSASPTRLTLTHPRASRTRAAFLARQGPLSASSGSRLKSSLQSAGRSPGSSIMQTVEQDTLLSGDYFDGDDDDGDGFDEDDEDGLALAKFDRRSEMLLRGSPRIKKAITEDCTNCSRYLDHATVLQAEINELRKTIDAVQEQSDREKQAWAEEKAKIERKREKSTQVLREELERASSLLREEVEAFNRRNRDMKAMFETESAREAAKFRAEIEEVRRAHDRQLADMRVKLVESETERTSEHEKLRSELVVAQSSSRALQQTCDERLREINALNKQLGEVSGDRDVARTAYDELLRERDSLRAACEQLGRENDALQKVITDKTTEGNSASTEERARLEAEIRSLNDAKAKSEQDRTEAFAQVEHLQKQLQLAASQQAEHARALDALRLANEHALADQAQSLASKYETQLQSIISERDRERAALVDELAREREKQQPLEQIPAQPFNEAEVEKWRGEAERWRRAAEAINVSKAALSRPRGSLLRTICVLATLLATSASVLLVVLIKFPQRIHYAPAQDLAAVTRDALINLLGASSLAAPPS